jgi:hypothetical protein
MATSARPRAYSIGTWDHEIGRFTPNSPDWVNTTWAGLLRVLRKLRGSGYQCNYKQGHEDNDPSVFVLRTEGMTIQQAIIALAEGLADAEPEPDRRRCMILKIGPTLLESICRTGRHELTVVSGVPASAKFEGASWDTVSQCFYARFSHPSFPICEDAALPPRVSLFGSIRKLD